MSQNIPKSKRLEVLEQICADGRAVFFMVGCALEEIKRDELYREKGFKNFGEYAESIGYTRRYCDQLIIDVEVVKDLPENLRNLIASERAARELGSIPKGLRLAVITEASNNGTKPVTRQAVKKLAPPVIKKPLPLVVKSKPVPKTPVRPSTLDATGMEVPKESLYLWNRSGDAQNLLTYIASVIGALGKARGDEETPPDILFSEVDFNSTIAHLKQAHADLQRAKPYAVCPSCQGKLLDEKCICHGRGFVSEFYWKTCIAQEIKDMRKKL